MNVLGHEIEIPQLIPERTWHPRKLARQAAEINSRIVKLTGEATAINADRAAAESGPLAGTLGAAEKLRPRIDAWLVEAIAIREKLVGFYEQEVPAVAKARIEASERAEAEFEKQQKALEQLGYDSRAFAAQKFWLLHPACRAARMAAGEVVPSSDESNANRQELAIMAQVADRLRKARFAI